jgi:prevent-host-death family protein
MDGYNIADLKAHLSDVVARVEAGESVEIMRRGKPAAKIVPLAPVKTRINFAALDAMVAKQPLQKTKAADIIREMRDAGY